MNLVRFDGLTRVVHWTTAALAGLLLLTGSILYVPQLSAMVGRRALVVQVHVSSGLLVLVPIVLGWLLPRGRALRADVAELSRWTVADRRWLRKRTRSTPAGKFNGGQKLATASFGGLLAVLLLTGSLMHWHDPFSDDWRTGATFVHDWAYLALAVLTIGHVRKAVQEPELLTAMRSGTVSRTWAERERPGWAQAEGAPVE